MNDLNAFYQLVGETFLFYLGIKRDAKLIQARILKDEFEKNYIAVVLGTVLKNLETSDNSEDKLGFLTIIDC